jgi:hypothetical protein
MWRIPPKISGRARRNIRIKYSDVGHLKFIKRLYVK